MRSRLILTLLFTVVLVSAAALRADGPRPAQAETTAAAVMSTDLLFECLPDNTIRVVFSWAGSGQGPQWVDLSLFDNGFAPATFLGSGPIDPAQSSLIWDGLLPAARHYVRVNTLTANGWFPSPTMIFDTPSDCSSPVTAPIAAGMPSSCNGLASGALSGCLWTPGIPDNGVVAIGTAVNYCYAISQPAQVRIIAQKPDGTALLVLDGFVSGGACIGPFQANVPLGARTVFMFAGPSLQLVATTHFSVQ